MQNGCPGLGLSKCGAVQVCAVSVWRCLVRRRVPHSSRRGLQVQTQPGGGMSNTTTDIGAGIAPGAQHYRAFVGATQTYDIFAHMQFSLLTLLGLRQEHTLLDIGCGSLRAGKLFLIYLQPDRYFGIEPEEWLVQEG